MNSQQPVIIDQPPDRPPLDFKMAWTFSRTISIPHTLSFAEFQRELKLTLESCAEEIKTHYAQDFYEELRKKNLLDLSTFPKQNGNGQSNEQR